MKKMVTRALALAVVCVAAVLSFAACSVSNKQSKNKWIGDYEGNSYGDRRVFLSIADNMTFTWYYAELDNKNEDYRNEKDLFGTCSIKDDTLFLEFVNGNKFIAEFIGDTVLRVNTDSATYNMQRIKQHELVGKYYGTLTWTEKKGGDPIVVLEIRADYSYFFQEDPDVFKGLPAEDIEKLLKQEGTWRAFRDGLLLTDEIGQEYYVRRDRNESVLNFGFVRGGNDYNVTDHVFPLD